MGTTGTGSISTAVEPEVVARFRSSLTSMSSAELRELVDRPTSQRSGTLIATLIRQHKKVLSDKINKIRDDDPVLRSRAGCNFLLCVLNLPGTSVAEPSHFSSPPAPDIFFSAPAPGKKTYFKLFEASFKTFRNYIFLPGVGGSG